MWRITDDHWDGWTFEHKQTASRISLRPPRRIRPHRRSGRPTSSPATGPIPTCSPKATSARIPARTSRASPRYTHDEQRTEFTLWAISRSPLILGANLTKLDDFTRSLYHQQGSHRPQSASRRIQARPAAEKQRTTSSLPAALLVSHAPAAQTRSATSPSSISPTPPPPPTCPGCSSISTTSPTPPSTSGTRSTSPTQKHSTSTCPPTAARSSASIESAVK